jgi:hypothetical protein
MVARAANMHRERCAGRITEVSESLTPRSRRAQEISKKKKPGALPGFELCDEFQFRSGARHTTRLWNYFASFAI